MTKLQAYEAKLDAEMNRFKEPPKRPSGPFLKCVRCRNTSHGCEPYHGFKSVYEGRTLCPGCFDFERRGDAIEKREKFQGLGDL